MHPRLEIKLDYTILDNASAEQTTDARQHQTNNDSCQSIIKQSTNMITERKEKTTTESRCHKETQYQKNTAWGECSA